MQVATGCAHLWVFFFQIERAIKRIIGNWVSTVNKNSSFQAQHIVFASPVQVFSMLLLSLNRKRFPLRTLTLDNCDLTDEKLVKLSPLIVKFERATLNGSQKMTAVGWDRLGATICKCGRLFNSLVHYSNKPFYSFSVFNHTLSSASWRSRSPRTTTMS